MRTMPSDYHLTKGLPQVTRGRPFSPLAFSTESRCFWTKVRPWKKPTQASWHKTLPTAHRRLTLQLRIRVPYVQYMTLFGVFHNQWEVLTATGTLLVEWSGGATGLDQGLPVWRPFRASWQMAIRSCPRFLHPLLSFRTAGLPQDGWKPAFSLRALPPHPRRRLTRSLRSFPPRAQSPEVSVRGCAHRPLAQRGLSCARLHIGICFFAAPPVLDAARVRPMWRRGDAWLGLLWIGLD